MPLKYTVESLDAIDPALREHYTPTPNGFRLELTGHETAEQLLESKRVDRDGRNSAIEKIIVLEKLAAEAATRQTEQDRKDAQAAEREATRSAEYERENTRKLAEHEAGIQARVASLRAARDGAALDRVAIDLSVKLAVPGSHELLLPHVRARLEASDADGVLSVSVKDASSYEHLAEQLRADPRFARVIENASPQDRAAHARRVAETLGTPQPRPPLTREKHEALPPAERAAQARGGAEIFDTRTAK